MGYWSETIMGGDAPLDYADDLLEHFEIEADYLELVEKEHLLESLKSALLKFNFEEDYDFDNMYQKHIGFQVLGVFYLVSGTKMPDDVQSAIIDAVNVELKQLNEWGNPSKRKQVLDSFLSMIKENSGDRYRLDEEGLLDHL